jgi:hypothetical protein
MSRRRSAFTTAAVVIVLAWFYVLALVLPVNADAVAEPWVARGRAWLGALVTDMLDGLSFLWGSIVRSEYVVPPESAWPTVVFVVLVIGLVYAGARTGSDAPSAVGGRVLGACVLAGGFTNLFSVVLTGARTTEHAGPFAGAAPGWVEDGVWFGIVLGLVGGSAAYVLAAVTQIATLLQSGSADSSAPSRGSRFSSARAGAGRVATWGVLPLLVVALVGGFVWDYGPDVDPDVAQEPHSTWLRLVWFAHARFAGPHNPHSLTGAFDTSVWLPRTLTSAALIVLVWIGIRLLVSRRQGGGQAKVLGIVLQYWGLVAVLAVVLGVIEGAVLPAPDPGPAAYYVALGNVTGAVRFGAFFGWVVGVAVALADRFEGSRAVQTVSVEQDLEASTD